MAPPVQQIAERYEIGDDALCNRSGPITMGRAEQLRGATASPERRKPVADF
jgi:hypothetical protein